MRKQGCAIAHTLIYPGNESVGCQHGSFDALTEFSRLSCSYIASSAHAWCSKEGDFFYGNLWGGASSFLRSEANTILNIWLYECHNGYFRYRWGDQATPALYVCHWIDAPKLNALPQVCDFTQWRTDGIFEHF